MGVGEGGGGVSGHSLRCLMKKEWRIKRRGEGNKDMGRGVGELGMILKGSLGCSFDQSKDGEGRGNLPVIFYVYLKGEQTVKIRFLFL